MCVGASGIAGADVVYGISVPTTRELIAYEVLPPKSAPQAAVAAAGQGRRLDLDLSYRDFKQGESPELVALSKAR